MFNGKDLTGWTKTNPTGNTGKAEVVVDDGQPALRLTNPFGLLTPTFGNYHLRLDCKTEPEAGRIHHYYLADARHLRLHWDKKGKTLDAFITGNNVTFQIAELRGDRIVPIGKTLTDQDHIRFSNFPVLPSGWQRVEILRLDDRFIYVINSKVVGAVANVRFLNNNQPELPEQSPLELYSLSNQALFRNIEIREINALPPEILKNSKGEAK